MVWAVISTERNLRSENLKGFESLMRLAKSGNLVRFRRLRCLQCQKLEGEL